MVTQQKLIWAWTVFAVLAGMAVAADPVSKSAGDASTSQYKAWQAAYKAGDLKTADVAAKKMLAAVIGAYGKEHAHTARTQLEYAKLYCDMGRFTGGMSSARQALTTREKLLGKDDPGVAEALLELGRIALVIKDFKTAEKYLDRCLEINQAQKTVKPGGLAEVQSYQALLRAKQGKLEGAEDAAAAAAEAIEKAGPGNDATLIRAWRNQAEVFLHTDDLASAESAAQKAVDRASSHWGASHPETLHCRYLAAAAFSLQRQETAAAALYEPLLADAERVLGPNHLLVSHVLQDLGNMANRGQETTKAEALLVRARKIKETSLGEAAYDVAITLKAIGNMKMNAGEADAAKALFDEALEIANKSVGEQNPFVADLYNSLANCLSRKKDDSGALAGWLRSVEIYNAVFGPSSRQSMAPTHNIALMYLRTNRAADAENVLREAIAGIEKRYGVETHEVVQLLALLASALPALDKTKELPALFTRAEEILRKHSESDTPELVWVLEGKAAQANRNVKPEVARDCLDRAQRIMHKHVTGVLTSLSESGVNSYMRDRFNPVFNRAVALSLSNLTDDKFTASAAAWVIKGKGLGTQALAERALQGREIQTSDPALRKGAADLRRVREQLAALVMLGAGSSRAPQAVKDKLAALQRTQGQLVDKLALALGDQAQAIQWTETTAVQEKVPEGSALIEIVRVNRTFSNGVSPWYVGFVIPYGPGRIKAFDLGPASDLDRVCLLFAEYMIYSAAMIDKQGEPKAEELIVGLMEQISDRILKPMLPSLNDSPDWIISPDGPMWMIPWSALRIGKEYVAETHRVRYVVSSRDLLAAPIKAEVGKPMIFSNPDYSAGMKLSGKGNKIDPKKLPFQPLPGSLVETKAITPAVTKWCGTAPVVRLGAQAREAAVKQVASPRLLMLSTHGFFFGFAGQPGVMDNPLLSCGLAFAGANDRKLDNTIGKDDGILTGILTGIEVMSLDLRGSEMVVLSACETAKGQPQAGEGVAGLRYAFHMAGAKNVVSTLWSIPDQETAYLMKHFFDAIAEGKTQTEALQAAQLKAIAERKKGGGTGHPFFWAAFALSQRGA